MRRVACGEAREVEVAARVRECVGGLAVLSQERGGPALRLGGWWCVGRLRLVFQQASVVLQRWSALLHFWWI